MSLLRADAVAIPLRDESVDLIVTSPPYFALRSYTDGGEHYDGQIGSEPTPQDFLEALWSVTAECRRVLKPSGSMFVNLGDKYAGSGGHNNSNLQPPRHFDRPANKAGDPPRKANPNEPRNLALSGANQGPGPATRRSAPDAYNKATIGGARPKSLMGLPWRYAIGCIDELDLILRAEIVWSKPNGLPESVTDRVRRSHEQWFHFTREGSYFADIDEVRTPYADKTLTTVNSTHDHASAAHDSGHAGHRKNAWARDNGLTRADTMHPRGALPPSVWTVATEPLQVPEHVGTDHFAAYPQEWPRRLILGWSPPDGVVLDPFGGTGTTAMVARALGRYPVHVDLSADYLRLANWRIYESGHASKSLARTNRERQGQLL